MKKLFGNIKNTHEEWDDFDIDDFDWDAPEEPQEGAVYSETEGEYDIEEIEGTIYADEDGGYYAEGTDGAVYADEDDGYYAEVTDGAVYADEDGGYYTEETDGIVYADEDGGYYAEEAGETIYADEDTEYYAEETDGIGYVAEDIEYYAEEADDIVYAEEEGGYDAGEDDDIVYADVADDEYYAEEDTDWYQEENPQRRTSKPKGKNQNVLAVLWTKFLEMGAMDRVITATGIAVLILALVTAGLYISTKAIDDQVSELAGVGTQLEGIGLIGEKGLLAVADAEMARQAAAEIVEEEEEQKEYDEEEYSNAVTVKLHMTSVMKDLKIKFTNKDTGKLVANVPFSVTITTPGGKSETWTDDDMDGIIYKKNITAGTYKVLVNELTEEKYKDYTLPSTTQTVEVKKDISYEKIDVSDEVKKESEIDVAKEDTKKNETVVESTLQDTVTWVESTAVAETYTEVSKSTIPDPLTLAMNKSFLRTAAMSTDVSGGNAGEEPKEETQEPQEKENVAFKVSIAPTTATLAIGGKTDASVTATGYTEGKTLKYSVKSSNEKVATAKVDASGKVSVTAVAAGSANVTVTVDYASGNSVPATATLKVTVPEKPVISLDKTTATVYVTEPVVINATLKNALTNAAVTAESSNTGVATVSVKEKAITITGVATGDATITVKYTENGQETQATCVVKVKIHPKNNKTDKLKDASGNQLYVLENETYREAVYADYYTASKFFIKGDVKYTGWQTLNGSVYYFTASGEKVTGEQIIQGAKYNFASDGSLITGSGTLGIDVSKWNGTIDWNAVKNSGVSYVIIRCGYRGSSQGMLIEDPKFNANIKGATEAGLKVGVYFFTQATDEIEAVEEASFVLDKIKNYRISYPVFLDVEASGGRGDKIDKATRTAVCKAFCETIQRGGYTAGIYANKTWLNEKIDAGSLSAYKIWLAQYAATPTYTGRYDLWQYKSTGRVSGISGDVDMNLSYLGY